jgi:hypothetical protein
MRGYERRLREEEAVIGNDTNDTMIQMIEVIQFSLNIIVFMCRIKIIYD